MVPTLADGTPLSELGEFKDRPHAYVKLWKHHAAQPEADRINELAARRGEPWLARYGGLISSEWEYAKGLELLSDAPDIYRAMERWVEGADWIVWQLCGEYVRNACSAGYKGILQDGQYPSREFLGELDPDFADFVADQARPADRPARWPRRLADRRDGRPNSGFPRASPSPSATSMPTSRPRRRGPWRRGRWWRSWARRRAT